VEKLDNEKEQEKVPDQDEVMGVYFVRKLPDAHKLDEQEAVDPDLEEPALQEAASS